MTVVDGWRIIQHLYPRLVFRETFTGDGINPTFQLDGTIGNGTFEYGSWTVARVETALPAHATKTDGGTLWDSLLPLVRNRVQVSSINGSGLVTLSYAPRSGVDFYVWYWYELRAGTKIDDYYREDFIAKMESDAGASLASQVSVDTANFGVLLSATEDTMQKVADKLDDSPGKWGPSESITISGGVATVTRPGVKILTSEAGATDDLYTVAGLSTNEEVILMAATGHTITVKNGTNIKCKWDFTITGYDLFPLFCLDGTICAGEYRGDNQ